MARGRHLRLLPSPQVAANQLGLTTQVPTQMIYQSEGATTMLLLGKRQIVFRRDTGRNLVLAGGPAASSPRPCGMWAMVT